jgi:biopolymer transport protein ExbD
MRRFSQRNHLVTLSDINITPLLDLAFVLLVIFIITTPLLEQGLELKLPIGGKPDQQLKREDFRTLELGKDGTLLFERKRMKLEEVEAALIREKQANPNLAVFFRADKEDKYGNVFQVQDVCARVGVKFVQRAQLPAGR